MKERVKTFSKYYLHLLTDKYGKVYLIPTLNYRFEGSWKIVTDPNLQHIFKCWEFCFLRIRIRLIHI